MAALLTTAYELGDMVKESAEMAAYLYWKERVDAQQDVQQLLIEFARKKELFAETERFGRFHPDYHEARKAVKEMEARLEQFEEVYEFKRAEEALDDMLYSMSKTIANSVSESIKVPSNSLKSSGGCGGGCSGNCSSC
ncbi:YlbF family regulator [Paenibacillus marinisediminis]